MVDQWFLEESAYRFLISMLGTADINAELNSKSGKGDGPTSRMTIKDGIAHIPVTGIMTKGGQGGLLRLLFGESTTYQGLIEDIEAAENNADVERRMFHYDTPGGAVNGAFDVAAALEQSSKENIAVIHGIAASGGYLFAAHADKIIASQPSDLVGSIGVVTRRIVNDSLVEITSTDAPFKAPDVKTERGIAAVKEELDMIHGHVVGSIARGRGITPEVVNKDFGRGMVLTADVALRRGMIDSIENSDAQAVGINSGFDARATAFQDLEIINRRWDSKAADRRVRRFFNSTEKPSRDYRKAFFWFDQTAADQFGSYKLPFVDVVEGKLIAVRNAVNAANSSMQGARDGVDIPEADRPAVQRHIDRYRRKIQEQDGGSAASAKIRTGGQGHMSLATLLQDDSAAKVEFDAAIKAAADQAESGERTRVVAHLENIGHSKDAVVKAIKEGSPFDAAAGSIYMNAAIKKQHGNAAVGDNAGELDTADGDAAAGGGGAGGDAAAAVAAVVDKTLDGIADEGKSGIFQ